MSPTLLEIVVAILLLFVAWQIGVRIAPRLIRPLISFWRDGKPPVDPGPRGPEKNITPPPAADETPSPDYASHRK